MAESGSRFLAVAVAIALVVSTPISFLGVAGGTHVATGDGADEKSVYPGQTVAVVNVSVGSDDNVYSAINTPDYGKIGAGFSAPTSTIPEMYIDTGDISKEFDVDDTVIRFRKLSNTDRNPSNDTLHQFPDDAIYIDSDNTDSFSDGNPIIKDNTKDGLLTESDDIIFRGNLPLVTFSETAETEIFLSSKGGHDGKLGVNEPVLISNELGELTAGQLNEGETELLRKGKAPIFGFDSIEGDPYYINQITGSHTSEYEVEEAIISEDGNGSIDEGGLSNGDKVIRDGNANLEPFSDGEIYFIDEVGKDLDQYNPSEAIIDDVGQKDGKLDGGDEILFSGKGHVTKFEPHIATYGSETVYIGNSNDEIYEDAEFLYVESGDNPGYNAGEDLVLSAKSSPDLKNDTNLVTELAGSTYTNIGFLDLNGNDKLDTVSEKEMNPGSEPIVKFERLTMNPDDEKINPSTNILYPSGDQSNVLEIQGRLFEGAKYQDIANAEGPYKGGNILFSDQKNSRVDELDTGELLVEKPDSGNQLTSDDYVIRHTTIDNINAKLIPNDIEYIDSNGDEIFDKSDQIIESAVPDDDIIIENDEIVDEGSGGPVNHIGLGFEFLDIDEDDSYDTGETVIFSDSVGDDTLDTTDSIHMSQIAPGKADVETFNDEFENDDSAEAYIDSGSSRGDLDEGDTIISASISHTGNYNPPLFGEKVNEFNDQLKYIDDFEDNQFTDGETIFFEKDVSKSPYTLGDRLTALTVQNRGTLSSDAVASVTLYQDGARIATTTTSHDGVWTLEPDPGEGVVPTGEAATNLSVTATLTADAPTGETLNFEISPVEDDGLGYEFDTGDRGMFFADGPPVGGIESGPTYAVADADDITADAIAFANPDHNGATAVELGFSDAIDPATTSPGAFTIETITEEPANVTEVIDHGSGRVDLVIESGVAPSAVESVSLGSGELAVTSGAAVPEQTLAVETTSVTVAEAEERPHVVYRGERVAVFANEGGGENDTPNLAEAVRIEGDTTGDETMDELLGLRSTGESSLMTVLDTDESNASAYRVTFQSEDGDHGETVTLPVEELSLSVTANRTNTTDVAGPIGATVSAAGRNRAIQAELLEAKNETILDTQTVALDSEGDGVVNFDPRVANVTIRVTDLGTGVTTRTENVTVREGHPGATFDREVFEEERGDVVDIGIGLIDTDNATVSIGSEAVNYHERITVVDRDDDGHAGLLVNTHRAGAGSPGQGIDLAGNENATRPDDRIADVRRTVPAATGLSDPLETGNYTLEVRVDGAVSDVALLRIGDRSTKGASTLVAPAKVDLDDPADVENWTTARERVAVGDQAVIAVEATGIDGFLNDSTDLRRGSAAAARTGAYVDIRRGNPPQNRPARRLNVSNATTLVDGERGGVYVVVPSEGGPYTIESGEEFDATFVLNESSPYVSGGRGTDDAAVESAETRVAFEAPDGRFTDLNENGTLDLQATANATITGETNVAPGTVVTITVRSDDDNVTFQKSDEGTVSPDGTFDGSVDLEEYQEGTGYTVVATANDDELTAVRTGSVVEKPMTVAAAQQVAPSGQPSGSGGDDADDEESTTETTSSPTRSTQPTTVTNTGASVGERAATFVIEDVPEFIRTQETNIVIVLGVVSFVYGLVGLRRLTR